MAISYNKITKKFLGSIFLITMLSPALHADEGKEEETDLVGAITGGKATIDLRLRYEFVDQAGFANNANASTLRTKLGYKTETYKGFSGVIEFEHSAELFGGDYNNAINGKTAYPAIVDANHTEVNQAYLAYTGIKENTIAVGRQAINIGNQRFVGTVGWRQNDQTFDSVAVINNSIEGLTTIYGYVWNVNRIFGNDHPMGDLKTKTHVINANYKGIKGVNIEGYGYLIDLDNIALKNLNSKTFGIRASGTHKINPDTKIIYSAEYAAQSDYKANPVNFSADYYAAEAGVIFKGLAVKAGLETLGSDNGQYAFQTPLATLHKFNGWADKFLATPVNGLRDFYGNISYAVKGTESPFDGIKFTIVYHDFKSDVGSIDYGSEIDISLSKKLFDRYTLLLKYANYNADAFATDTTKFWFQIAAKF